MAADGILLRPVELADTESFHGYASTLALERRFWGKSQPKALPEQAQRIATALVRKTPFIVAVEDGRVVGHADLAVPQLEGYTHLGSLGMGLLPEYRGRGLGLSLLTAIVSAGWNYGLTRIELLAYGSNTLAISMYERFGFQHEGRRRKARLLDGEYDDVVFMSLLREDLSA